MKTYTNPVYGYRRAPELGGTTRHCGVVVVGAGPVGLAAAIDLAQQGIPVLVLDDDDTVSVGSRAICYAKRTLEILDRLGCGETIARKGVSWSVGKVFHGDRLAFQFDLLPEPGHHRPAFVNLQQYHFEECMVRRAESLPAAEIRWKHRVVDVAHDDAYAVFLHLTVRGLLSAAVRLGAIGPTEAQAIHGRLTPVLDAALVMARTLTVEDVAQTSPITELVQAGHDRLYTRLFQS